MIRLSLGVLLLMFSVQPADAACTLKGRWDVYLTLSHPDDEDNGFWPPATAVCSLSIDRDGRMGPSNCDGVWNGQELDVFVVGFLKLDRNCRILDTAELTAVVQTGFEQSQDEYFCRMRGTMERSGQTLHGFLDCGHAAGAAGAAAGPEPFVMVRQWH